MKKNLIIIVGLLIIALSLSVNAINLTSNLTAFYNMNEGDNAIKDSLGLYNFTTVTNVFNVSGRVGSGLQGNKSSLAYRDNTYMSVGLGAFTMNTWIYDWEIIPGAWNFAPIWFSGVTGNNWCTTGSGQEQAIVFSIGVDGAGTCAGAQNPDVLCFGTHREAGGTRGVISTNISTNKGSWHMYTGIRQPNGTLEIYIDGAFAGSSTPTLTTLSNNCSEGTKILGSAVEGSQGNFTTKMVGDSFGFWKKPLTTGVGSELEALLSAGAGLEYPFSIAAPTVPSIYFNSPGNQTTQYYTNTDLVVNTSAAYYGGSFTVQHYLYNSTGSLLQNKSANTENLTSTFTGLTIGTYYINASIANSTNINWTETRTIYIYKIIPASINQPINNSIISNESVYLNWSDGNTTAPVVLTLNYNVTLLNKDTTFNKSITTGITSTNFLVNMSTNSGATYILNVDSKYLSDFENDRVYFDYIKPTLIYNTTVIEGETYLYMLNLSKDAYINKSKTVTGSLIFNGTSYAGTSWDDDNSTGVYVLLTIPQTSNTTTTDFYFTYNINDQSYNTSLYRVTVLLMPPIAVNATDCNGLTPAMNFIMRDEENLTNLTGTIDYVFQFGLTNGSYKNISGSLTTGIMKLCINSTLYPTWTLGTGEIHYTSPGYVSRRYYVFSNTRITNITINITLFNLLSSSQTSFDLVVESTSLIPYSNKYTSLIRWYPSTNNYDVVDMGKTDETGSTVIHVKTEDVDYRIGVYELNGSLIKLANPIRMVCLTSPCTYTMRIGDDNIDYAELLRIEATLDFNETTNIWTLVYNDPSQKTSEMNLTVYKDTGSSSYVVCNNHLNAYTGAIRCNTTGYDGTLRAVVTRSASPGVPVLVKIVSLITSNFKSNWGLFLTFLIMIPIIMIFAIISPIAGIIGAVVSLIPAFYFGSISLAIISGVAILAGITLHFLNRSGGTR